MERLVADVDAVEISSTFPLPLLLKPGFIAPEFLLVGWVCRLPIVLKVVDT